ncbi:MAG: FHA domain-containing protein [Actinobacteria bacterium]|nr:FHA domain-containing protein [Actinomycetota bacterium]
MAKIQFKVLGPVEVLRDGTALPLGGPKQRSVLAVLVISANVVVPTSRLVDAVWGDDAHARAPSTLQVYVANLRKVLEPGVSARDGFHVLLTQAPGYKLVAAPDAVDLLEFEGLVADGRRALAASQPEHASARLRQALDLWRGEPLADLRAGDIAVGETTRLQELRVGALADRVEADLGCGRHDAVVGELEALVARHPFHERLRGLQMLALYRSGRQADALRAYEDARSFLVDELGIDPSAPLRELEGAILRQDPALDAVPGARSAQDEQMLVPTRRVAPGDSGLGTLTLPGGTKYLLGSAPCTIGRVSECSLTIVDPDVSRRHAVIRPVDGGHAVTDLGSTNGTVVNGTAITSHALAPGDEILLGSTVLRYDSV